MRQSLSKVSRRHNEFIFQNSQRIVQFNRYKYVENKNRLNYLFNPSTPLNEK